LFFTDNVLGIEFLEFKQPDAAMYQQGVAGGVTQFVVVGVKTVLGEQVFIQQPKGIGGLELWEARPRADGCWLPVRA
jgi:hypothetical protein